MPASTPIIETVVETGSTNADLAERLALGEQLPEGYWLQAETQTAGRGRHGREWLSPSGNLHCSTVVRLGVGDPPAQTLSFVAALAVYDTLATSLLSDTPIMLKWPNDALVFGDKIAGILAERVGDAVVVGIGINVCYAPTIAGRETASILWANGKHGGSTNLVLKILAERFAHRLIQWRSDGLSVVLADWTHHAHPIGSELTISDESGAVLKGRFAGLASDGALRLTCESGEERIVRAGDVALARVSKS